MTIPLAIGEGRDAASCLEEAALGQHRLMSEARDGDRQMFSLIVLAAEGCWPSFMRHLKDLQADVGRLIRAGITSEEFAPVRVDVAASCFLRLGGLLVGSAVDWSAFERA
jgi:hypothetical protein